MSKVINMFSHKKKEVEEEIEEECSLKDIMEKNEKNKERMKQDRLKKNRGTLRSYRIKN